MASALRACVLLALVALAPALGGCKARGDRQARRVELTVFAASSLTEAFEQLERGFERVHPTVDVQLSFAGSQILRVQIEHGAAADVFASADPSHMRALEDAGLVSESRTFAHNELVLIVPRRNPAGIESFEQLDQAARIVIGTDEVPVGIYARQILERARATLGEEFVATVLRHVVSEESNVRLVRAKVELGEADAALVYRTDAASSSRVRVVPIPDASKVRASYSIGPSAGSPHAREAAAFVDYVSSQEGRELLGRHGFVTEAP